MTLYKTCSQYLLHYRENISSTYLHSDEALIIDICKCLLLKIYPVQFVIKSFFQFESLLLLASLIKSLAFLIFLGNFQFKRLKKDQHFQLVFLQLNSGHFSFLLKNLVQLKVFLSQERGKGSILSPVLHFKLNLV